METRENIMLYQIAFNARLELRLKEEAAKGKEFYWVDPRKIADELESEGVVL